MSYEPRLLIKTESLEMHNELLDEILFGTKPRSKKDEKTRGGEGNQTVLEFLESIRRKKNASHFNFLGHCLILCHPTLATFNKNVRAKLDELEIEYVVID